MRLSARGIFYPPDGHLLRSAARFLISVEGSSCWTMQRKRRMLTKSYFPWNSLGKGANASCICNETFLGSQFWVGYCAGVISKQSK